MLACESQLERLVDAATGELPESARRELDAHAANCAGCREELAAMRETEQLLRATSNAPDDLLLSGFAVRVADRAEAFRDRSARGLWWALTRAMRFTVGFSTAATAMALVLFVQSRAPVMVKNGPVAPPTAGPVLVATTNAASDLDEEELSDDPVQIAEEDQAEPSVSLDSALDSLTPAELDELTQKLAANEG